MKYLVLFSFITLGLGDPGLLGTKECTYGPSYWCSHIANAQKCGAIQHCKDTVWKNQKIKPKDTVECSVCKIGIEEVKMILKQNGSQAKIEKYLQEVCDLLPETQVKDECNSVIKNYLPVIMDLLKSNMTAEQICATIKMCTGFEDQMEHKEIIKQELNVKTSNACQDCKNFFTDVQNMIVSNETQEQLIGLFKQTVCAQLGPLQDMCNFVVEEYVPDALQYLGSSVDPDVTCRLIGFCTSKDLFLSLRIRMQNKKLFKQYNKKSIGGDENCDICKNVIKDVQSLDQDATTQDKIKDVIKKELCGHLGDLANECDDLVDKYASQLFELLANELDPETVCSFIGFCRKTEKTSPPALVRVTLTKSHPIKALSLLPAKLVQPSKPVQGSPIECSVCKLIMNELDSILQKNATSAEIQAALDAVCSRLPSGLNDQCKAFVNEYAPAILAMLEQELNPSVVCDKIGICTPIKQEPKTNVKVKANVTCILCEFVMSELERQIAANRSREAIKAALDKICSLMPDTISAECTVFVQQYSSLIINLLLQEVQPKQVCKTLRLCTEVVRRLPQPVSGILLRGAPVTNKEKPVLGPEGCLVCETLMNYLDEALKENRTEAAIKFLLMHSCEVLKPLGESWEQECEGIITAFGDEIVKMLAQELDPKEICKVIGLCTSAKRIKELPKNPFVAVKEKPVDGAGSCLVCEALLHYLDEALKGNRSEAAIKSLLMRSCEVLKPLGESWEEQCQGIVIAFGDVIVKMLTQELDPKQVCKEIGLCSAKKINKKLSFGAIKDELKNVLTARQKLNNNKLYFKPRTNLGKKKCGYGPSYWCKSLDTAKECGMEEHCKKVWSRNRA